jgi:two-component system chemotaxis response regulator CheV
MSFGSDIDQMTKGHLRNVQQLAVFYTGSDSIYAINIAKVKAFIITEEVTINPAPIDNPIIAGIATIRDEPVTLIKLDSWILEEPKDINEYKLIIYCEFNSRSVGFLIKDMLDIVEKTTDELINAEQENPKVTYTTYVDVKGKKELCTVFNAEQLLTDIGWSSDGDDQLKKMSIRPIHNDKILLIAEDSAVARDILQKYLDKAEVAYEMYNNGQLLINRINEISPTMIGMIMTDIEMPEKDGYQVVTYLREKTGFENIPIIINSSMTTTAVRHKMELLGVNHFIGKTNLGEIDQKLREYLI